MRTEKGGLKPPFSARNVNARSIIIYVNALIKKIALEEILGALKPWH
jgi:hypothetical protein